MNKLFVSVIFLIGAVFLFSFVLAYSPYYTHPDFTEEIAKLWNLKNDNSELDISQNEIEWMRQGAINEDTPARWINHFYDPVHNTGWSGKHFGYLSPEEGLYEGESMAPKLAIASIDWVTNQEYQSAYGRQYGNQTWQKALKMYVDGDRKAAFTALGHILHLIEDSSVPDHTRNDTHADLYGDPGSPYEKYSKEYTNSNQNKLNIAENLKNDSLFDFSTIQDAFNHLANYSNNNFFSEDTISNDGFDLPDLKQLENKTESIGNKKLLFLHDKQKQIYLAVLKEGEKYSTKNDSFILPSYFSHLSSQAVLTGASVLDLFFREAEKYKQNPELLPAVLDDTSENILSYLQKSPRLALVNASDIYEKTKVDTQIYYTKASNFLSSIVSIPLASLSANISGISKSQSLQLSQVSIIDKNISEGSVIPSFPDVKNIDMIEAPILNSEAHKQPILDERQTEFIAGNDVPPIEITASSTTDVVDQEATSTQMAIVADIDTNQATTTVVIATSTVAVANQGGGWASASIPNNFSQDDNSKQEKKKDDISYSTSTDDGTATSTDGTITSTSTDDTLTATSTIDIFSIFQAPIIIDEIAWMGTKASSNDEWIELYNKTDYEVDLTGWTLENSNNLLINIEGKISPKGYFLLERTASTTTDVKESQVYTGVLNNSGEAANLYLKRSDGETVDFVSQWYAGNNSEKRSMERISVNATGDQIYSWATFSGTPFSKDAEGNDVLGTPGASNSIALAYTPISGDIATSTVWRKIESPYRIVGDVNVLVGADLTIEPSVVIQMPSIAENGDFAYPFDIYGVLKAQGTESEKIIFQGGFGSVRFLDSDSATSTLDYVEMNSGGMGKPINWHSKIYQGALRVENSNVSISNCKIENSVAFGVFLAGIYNFDMQNCHISGTSQIRMIELYNPWVYGYGIFGEGTPKDNFILKDNIFESNFRDISIGSSENGSFIIENNAFNAVDIHGIIDDDFLMNGDNFRENAKVYLGAELRRDFTFQNGIRYYIRYTDVRGSTLKIEPGVIVKMDRDSILTAWNGAILDFSGTENEKIIFQGESVIDPQGRWRGIVIKGSSKAIFNNIEFNDGGTDSSGAVLTIEGGDVSVSNAFFNNSRLGIYALGNGNGNGSPINLNIEHSVFSGSKYQSVLVFDSSASVSISNSNIFPSYYTDVNINKYPAFESYALEPISIRGNWWGDASGPYHEILNPDGLGAKIAGNVDFAPWSESEF